jgi:hypothetical protein
VPEPSCLVEDEAPVAEGRGGVDALGGDPCLIREGHTFEEAGHQRRATDGDRLRSSTANGNGPRTGGTGRRGTERHLGSRRGVRHVLARGERRTVSLDYLSARELLPFDGRDAGRRNAHECGDLLRLDPRGHPLDLEEMPAWGLVRVHVPICSTCRTCLSTSARAQTRFSWRKRAETCHRGPVKTPAERGPFPTWVVETRNALDLTAEWIAAQTGYDDATIRKLEGGTVTRPQMRIPPVPGEEHEPTADATAVLRAIEKQTEMLERQWEVSVALVKNLTDLVEELRQSRAQTVGQGNVLVDLLAELRDARLPASSEAEDAPRPPVRARGRDGN